MRSVRLVPAAFGVSSLATAALLAFAGCSSPPTESIPELQQQDNGGSSGSGSGGGSGSGSSSGGNNGGSSGGGSSSGGTASSSGSSSSGSSSGGTTTGATISADTTWANGTTITEATTIASGVTVTIASGATITVSAGAAITVKGTLVATTGTPHALMTGTGWTGFVIPAGGTITADSLDITGASSPMDVTGTATYDNGILTGATVPILVEAGGSLSMTSSKVTGAVGSSRVNGNLTLSKCDYDKGTNEGMTIGNAASIVKIDNTTFHGANNAAGDFIVSNACASLTMTYSTITGCHCAYHFNAITSFDLENMDLHGDSYGFMAYGSSPTAGTRVFKNSNVETMAASGIDESGTNGAITVSGVYFDTASTLTLTDQEITVSAAATAPLPSTEVGPQ